MTCRLQRKKERPIRKLEKRNKHIRIADKAKSGWKAIELYQTDDVASGPEDEKKDQEM